MYVKYGFNSQTFLYALQLIIERQKEVDTIQKRGMVELYVFLAFAIIAMVGLTYTMLYGIPAGMAYHGGDWGSMPLQPSQEPTNYQQYGGMIPYVDQPGNFMISQQGGSIPDCQSSCFGTVAGMSPTGQQPLGGAELRQCLANCQAGISYQKAATQECYTCSAASERITAEDGDEANTVCKRMGGASATITKFTIGPCAYS